MSDERLAQRSAGMESCWVLKLGSSTLLAGGTAVSEPRLLDYVRVVVALQQRGIGVVLVSSGAVSCGRSLLPGLATRRTVPAKQMFAAVGQPRLMALYGQLFGHYGLSVAQVLLTRADFEDRRRYLNARNTFAALLEHGIVPIVNENDTVATEEIRVGDNDQLAGLVASLVGARKLVLMTDVDGLYDADPRRQAGAARIEHVREERIPEALWAAAGGSGSVHGTGGMGTKLRAAEIARRGGADVHIADGARPERLLELAAGQPLGTCIHALLPPREARKRYVMNGLRPAGAVSIDAGAARALTRGSSLLAVGISAVHGEFERGDTIEVRASDGQALARGLARYGAGELRRICGARSERFEALLGYTWGDELVHRNDLVLLAGSSTASAA